MALLIGHHHDGLPILEIDLHQLPPRSPNFWPVWTNNTALPVFVLNVSILKFCSFFKHRKAAFIDLLEISIFFFVTLLTVLGTHRLIDLKSLLVFQSIAQVGGHN